MLINRKFIASSRLAFVNKILGKTFVGLAVFTFLSLLPNLAQGDATLSSDFVLQLDNSLFEAPQFELKPLLSAKDLKVQLPDMVVQNLLPVYVTGIDFSLNYKFETAADYPLLGTEVAAASTDFSGTLRIAKVEVNGEIRQRHGDIEVIGHLNATCTDIRVELLPGKAQAMGSVLVQADSEGKPTLSVPWFDISWPSDAWAVTSISCTGADGFDIKLKEELLNYLRDSKSFAPQFKTFIDKTAREYETLIRDYFAHPIELPLGIKGLKSFLRPGRIENLRGDQFQLRGVVDFAFASTASNETIELTESAILPTQNKFSVGLPNGFVSALSGLAYKAGFFKMSKFGSEMRAFSEFRTNGFEVSVAWPELGWYPKEMDFRFDFKTPSQPKFGPLKNDGSGGLAGDLTGLLKVDVWAQEFTSQMKYHRFGQFSTPLAAQYSLSIVPDVSSDPALQIKFSQLAMNLSYGWDVGYTPKNPTVAVDLIGDQLRDSLVTSPLIFTLGKFAVHENLTLAPSALRQTGPWLLLDFKK